MSGCIRHQLQKVDLSQLHLVPEQGMQVSPVLADVLLLCPRSHKEFLRLCARKHLSKLLGHPGCDLRSTVADDSHFQAELDVGDRRELFLSSTEQAMVSSQQQINQAGR